LFGKPRWVARLSGVSGDALYWGCFRPASCGFLKLFVYPVALAEMAQSFESGRDAI
jgi:hypothetical protein